MFQTEHPYAKRELGSFAAKPREKCGTQVLCISSSQMFQTEHPYAKREPGSFAAKPRENVACRFCASLHCKRFCMMTRVQRCTDNVVRFASVILGIFLFVKLGKLAFVYLVTLPFVNLVTLPFVILKKRLPFVKFCS